MPLEFRCGKMKMDSNGTTVRPDTRKGKLVVSKSEEDGLTHLTWTDRTLGLVEDDFIIFPGDASFVYVDSAKENAKNNRVYSLKFDSTKRTHFFWMQEPKSDKDEELSKKVHAMINGEEIDDGQGANLGQMDQAQILAMLTQARHRPQVSEEGAARDAVSDQPAGPAAAAQGGDTNASAADGGDASEDTSGGGEAGSGGGNSMDVDVGDSSNNTKP